MVALTSLFMLSSPYSVVEHTTLLLDRKLKTATACDRSSYEAAVGDSTRSSRLKYKVLPFPI